jgi:hypothetical protein
MLSLCTASPYLSLNYLLVVHVNKDIFFEPMVSFSPLYLLNKMIQIYLLIF